MSLSNRNYDLGEGNLTNKDKIDTIIYWGLVVADASQDPSGAGRIKVRVRELDKEIRLTRDLPWASPLLPKFINVSPKKGETVKIMVFNKKNTTINRFFIGPFISQPQKYEFDPHFFESRSGLDQGLLDYKKAWFIDPESKIENTNWSVFSETEDITLNGRRNQDIIIRDREFYDEVLFRVGKCVPNNPTKVNKKNPTYISMVYLQKDGIDQPEDIEIISENRGHVNFVADQINLISHKGSPTKGTAPVILNSDNPLQQVLTENNKLHPIPYGDMFWEFVTRVRDYVESHIHEGPELPSDKSGSTLELLNWIGSNLGTKNPEAENPDGTTYVKYDSPLLSKGIKIN
jgi:hypothetical protein